MSEEILKALTHLFAIVTKQDDGVSDNERQFVNRFFQQELDQTSIKEYIALYDEYSGYNKQGGSEGERNKLTSVKDSVRTLGICRKINKTLTQKQKVVVLIKLLELVGSDKNFTAQRMELINTVSTVFNISKDEYGLIEAFVVAQHIQELSFNVPGENSSGSTPHGGNLHDHVCIDGDMIFLRVSSVDMYFVKCLGEESNMLNGFMMQPNRVYLYSHGSTIKKQSGKALYYSDLAANFNAGMKATKLSFEANIEEFKFQHGAVGLRNVVISEGPGKLIGIMGASGAGKTTLLNVLAGLEKPSKGEILINGFDIHSQKDSVHGVIGYVPQDDFLIEELTVYQNLYFNAKLCFSDFSESQLRSRVDEVLKSLGLEHRKELRVGNSLDKTISGGQRKRLNIALELIREPAILFLDEPTSGLSSRDSENVIDLLKELSLKGKLIFMVIHQPSSDIYKMFDKMFIMDVGGYPIYYGSPVEAVTYFKKATHQADSNRGQCESCGNVNPEQIFNIIEAKVVDEYGQSTSRRKVTPHQWNEMYDQAFHHSKLDAITEEPPHNLHIPGKIRQTIIFSTRDLLAKLSNKQYLLINLFEAPLLAAILALVIRYKNSPEGKEYLFRYNDNIPAFILMSIIVALFMGLTVSAEEIIRDRKILKRESFLNLSWNSYLLSKLTILFSLSAIQTLSFVIVGNLILEIHGMVLPFWTILFATSVFANIVGLNISSAFNSAVTVYVIIPLLLIPQMIFSGTLFSFDKLNEHISTQGRVPLVADLMVSRWAYEAMAVYQFQENEFQRHFFEYEKRKSIADFKSAYLADELRARTQYAIDNLMTMDDSTRKAAARNLLFIRHALKNEPFHPGGDEINIEESLTPEKFNAGTGSQMLHYLDAYEKYYQDIYNYNVMLQEKKMDYYVDHGWDLSGNKNAYVNESLSDLVRNVNSIDRVKEHNNAVIQLVDPVFQEHRPDHALDYRTAFFASQKNLLGLTVSTFYFNILVILMMCCLLYITLYTEVLRKLVSFFGSVQFLSTKSRLINSPSKK